MMPRKASDRHEREGNHNDYGGDCANRIGLLKGRQIDISVAKTDHPGQLMIAQLFCYIFALGVCPQFQLSQAGKSSGLACIARRFTVGSAVYLAKCVRNIVHHRFKTATQPVEFTVALAHFRGA